ncbi:unnamed protein product [Cutaneotrichosporon oleaginosum]
MSLMNGSFSATDEPQGGLDGFQPFDTASPSVRRTQSGTIPRGRYRLDTEPVHLWATPATEGQHEARATRPPNLRRATDSATMQTILNGMNETAQAMQRHYTTSGSYSTPLSPAALTARSYTIWGKSEPKPIPPENIIVPERITAGLDKRTTVMVKDVPVVPGEFDFVYLRFDFSNHCNVGYAFVNFTSTRALLHFYRARVGKRWNMFSSEKVLQTVYATIQGKIALVNKFR